MLASIATGCSDELLHFGIIRGIYVNILTKISFFIHINAIALFI